MATKKKMLADELMDLWASPQTEGADDDEDELFQGRAEVVQRGDVSYGESGPKALSAPEKRSLRVQSAIPEQPSGLGKVSRAEWMQRSSPSSSSDDESAAMIESGVLAFGSEEDYEEATAPPRKKAAPMSRELQGLTERLKTLEDQAAMTVLAPRSDAELEAERRRSQAIVVQRALWDESLDVRVRMQPLMTAALRLPQAGTLSLFQRITPSLAHALHALRSSVHETAQRLAEMLAAQSGGAPSVWGSAGIRTLSRASSLDEASLDAQCAALLAAADQQIYYWGRRAAGARPEDIGLRYTAGKHKSADLEAMRARLADLAPLRTKSQRLNTDVRPLGPTVPAEAAAADVYDDVEFYHRLLRELLEAQPADLEDPILAGRRWLEVHKLRTKTRRASEVDRKASKGRKLRYDVLPKLVNFMPPVDTTPSPWNPEQIFSSSS